MNVDMIRKGTGIGKRKFLYLFFRGGFLGLVNQVAMLHDSAREGMEGRK